MDTSKIKKDEVSTNGGFHTGNPDAPVKLVEYLNLRCPHCKTWCEESKETIQPYMDQGIVERVTKLYDKDKESLRKGNLLHKYLDYENHDNAMKDIEFFLATQEDWGELEEEDVARYAVEKRNLSAQPNEMYALEIKEEVARANVEFVPTVFIGDYILDEHVTSQELRKVIEETLEKTNN